MDENKKSTKENTIAEENITEVKNENVKKMLFNDLSLYSNEQIVVVLTNGTEIEGKLIYFDEIANCVLERNKENESIDTNEGFKTFVFGKSIAMIYK